MPLPGTRRAGGVWGGGEAGRWQLGDQPIGPRVAGHAAGASPFAKWACRPNSRAVLIGQERDGGSLQFVYLASPLPSGGSSLAHASAVRTLACPSPSGLLYIRYTPPALTYIPPPAPHAPICRPSPPRLLCGHPSTPSTTTMAAVSGPSTARHPSPFRRATKISSRPPPAPSSGASGHHSHPIVSLLPL